jgi:hypothetical protein
MARQSYEPTREQIRNACQKIRSKWNEHQTSKRSGDAECHWTVPELSYNDIRGSYTDLGRVEGSYGDGPVYSG